MCNVVQLYSQLLRLSPNLSRLQVADHLRVHGLQVREDAHAGEDEGRHEEVDETVLGAGP